MAGTIVFSKIQDGILNTTSSDCVFGNASVWVNFNGTGTVAVTEGYNVSSITDGGVGIYTINFTTDLANANYCHVFGAQIGTGFTGTTAAFPGYSSQTGASAPEVKTTSALKVLSADAGGANAADLSNFCVAIFGG